MLKKSKTKSKQLCMDIIQCVVITAKVCKHLACLALAFFKIQNYLFFHINTYLSCRLFVITFASRNISCSYAQYHHHDNFQQDNNEKSENDPQDADIIDQHLANLQNNSSQPCHEVPVYSCVQTGGIYTLARVEGLPKTHCICVKIEIKKMSGITITYTKLLTLNSCMGLQSENEVQPDT